MTLFAVLDFETTGLSPARGERVVEIGLIVLDERFRVVRMFDSLVYPQRSIPAQVSRIHGISDAAVRKAPTFEELLPSLMNCLAGVTHLVAHNTPFDLGFLQAELRTCGVGMPQSFGQICTMQMARSKRVAADAKLATVAHALGVPTVANAHRAIVDAGITARILGLMHANELPQPHGSIAWPQCRPVVANVSERSREFPRRDLCISMQTLPHFGLVLAPSAKCR